MSDRMTDERLQYIDGYLTIANFGGSMTRELLDALIAERAEVERLKLDDHARHIAELDEGAANIIADRDKYRAMAEWIAEAAAKPTAGGPLTAQGWLAAAEEATRPVPARKE